MPRIRVELADQGIVASRKRIASVMRLARIRGVSHRRVYVLTTTRDKRQGLAPDLIKVHCQKILAVVFASHPKGLIAPCVSNIVNSSQKIQ